MLSQFWPVVLYSGYLFFISLLTALEEFHTSLCGLADSDPEVCLSLFVAVLVDNNGSGMHSSGFAGLHAPRAMFLTFAGRSAALVVNSGSGMLLLVLLVFSHFALRSRRLPAGVSMCALCTSWFMA